VADGNIRTGKTGQLAKQAQPVTVNLFWHSQLSLTWIREPGFQYWNIDGQKIQLSYNNVIASANGDLDGGTSHLAHSGCPRL
jgi:hypothetical protein